MRVFKSNNNLGSIYATFSGFLYGFLGYFGISALSFGSSYSNMLFWRFFISMIFLIPFLNLKTLKTYSFSVMLKVFLSGFILYSLCTVSYFFSSKYIGTGQAMVVFFIYPAIVLVIKMIFFSEKISSKYYVSFAFIILGMTCLVDLNSFAIDLYGIFIGIFSATLYALYVLVSDKIEIDSYSSTFLVSFGCAASFLIWAIYDRSLGLPKSYLEYLNICGLGIISTAIPILLFLQSLKYISSEKACMLSVLEPIFVLLLGVILLGEKVSFIEIIGVALILLGAMITLSIKERV